MIILLIFSIIFYFLYHFSESSLLKTFSYTVISTMLLLHTSEHTKSIHYFCLFKIYTLERQTTLSLTLVNQHNRISDWKIFKLFFSHIWNEWISFFPSEKLIDPWKKSKCLSNIICLHNTLTNNYLHVFSFLWTHVCIYVSLNTCSIIYISFVLINWVWRNICF